MLALYDTGNNRGHRESSPRRTTVQLHTAWVLSKTLWGPYGETTSTCSYKKTK